MLSQRIIELKDITLKRAKEAKNVHFEYDYHYAALNLFNKLSHSEKLARSMAYAITNQEIYAYKDDKIGGRSFYWDEKEVIEKCEELDYISEAKNKFEKEVEYIDELEKNQFMLSNSLGHITWRFDKILSLGVEGFKEEVLNYKNNTNDLKKIEFYNGVLIMLDALLDFNDKYVAKYKELGNLELSNLMQRVPRYKALTFKEALQSFYMQHIVVMRENPYGGNGPGRLDYYLWPYLENDLKNNIITLEEAKELIDELFLMFEERLHDVDMWVEAIVIGGTNEKGESTFNPLSHLLLQSLMDLKVLHPAIYVRLPKDPDDSLISLCSEYLLSGNNRAQILNDTSIIEALIKNGVPYNDAVHYTCGGCMEINIQGMNSDFLYVGWQNTLKMLELMITGGICLKTKERQNCFKNTKSLLGYDDFDSFYNDFIIEAKRITHIALYKQDIYSELIEKNRPSFLISSMIYDCLERGKNMHAGGVRYHDYGGTPLALPNVIDGLYAIKYAVFDKKICSKEELLKALFVDYNGYENLQQKLRNIPKYGEDNDEVDVLASKVFLDFSNIYLSYKTRHNGKGKPMYFTFIHAPACASILGSTADGYSKNITIAQGSTPSSCSMKKGLTSAMNSCLKLPYDSFYGGASSMWDFDSSWINKDLLNALLKTFIKNNGQIFQGNTTSLNELIEAKKHPEKYPNLIVRVGGYSAKFVNLWPELQDEVISRLRHSK